MTTTTTMTITAMMAMSPTLPPGTALAEEALDDDGTGYAGFTATAPVVGSIVTLPKTYNPLCIVTLVAVVTSIIMLPDICRAMPAYGPRRIIVYVAPPDEALSSARKVTLGPHDELSPVLQDEVCPVPIAKVTVVGQFGRRTRLLLPSICEYPEPPPHEVKVGVTPLRNNRARKLQCTGKISGGRVATERQHTPLGCPESS